MENEKTTTAEKLEKGELEQVPQSPAEPKIAKMEFYILEKDKQRMEEFMEMAYTLKLIKQKTFQDFMQLCFNCAAGYIIQEVKSL